MYNLFYHWWWVLFSNEIFMQIILCCPRYYCPNNTKCLSTWRGWEWWWPLWSMLSDRCNILYYSEYVCMIPSQDICPTWAHTHTSGRKEPALHISHLCQQHCLISFSYQSKLEEISLSLKIGPKRVSGVLLQNRRHCSQNSVYCVWIIKWYWLW